MTVRTRIFGGLKATIAPGGRHIFEIETRAGMLTKLDTIFFLESARIEHLIVEDIFVGSESLLGGDAVPAEVLMTETAEERRVRLELTSELVLRDGDGFHFRCKTCRAEGPSADDVEHGEACPLRAPDALPLGAPTVPGGTTISIRLRNISSKPVEVCLAFVCFERAADVDAKERRFAVFRSEPMAFVLRRICQGEFGHIPELERVAKDALRVYEEAIPWSTESE